MHGRRSKTTAFDCVTFDCYGTLIDWREGIGDAFVQAAREDGVTLAAGRVLDAYAAVEPAVQAERYRTYRDVLTIAAQRTAERVGWRIDADRASFLPASLPRWRPFADVNPGLAALHRGGYRLGILSNVDDDLLRETLSHFRVPFDLIVTAEQVRAYKPAHAHFLAARQRIGPARWLHAAQSYFHDVVPARELEIPVAWVNRLGERPAGGARPDTVVRDVAGRVEWMG
jgi:2-haloalkanoic acid dehalogenase type II